MYIDLLVKIFEPFYEATKCLSARKVSTLSMSYLIKKKLFQFLTTYKTNAFKEKIIKDFLFSKFKYHLEDKITKEEKRIVIVSFNYFNN